MQNPDVKEKVKQTQFDLYGHYGFVANPGETSYNGFNISSQEREVLAFIQQNYNGDIITNSKSILDTKQELDIYLPDLNLAFEFNGTYWHSHLHKTSYYHQNKTDQALKQGVSLIHIWEHDWLNKPNIIKSMILNKLNKTPHRIYARKCIIKEVNYYDAQLFLEQNHLHGKGKPHTYSRGLYYNNQLVSVITVTQEGEIARFASLISHNVIGGFGKLFKSLKDKIKFTYAYQDWTPDGNKSIYNSYFLYNKITKPMLFYYNRNNSTLYSRWAYRKLNLSKLFKDYNNENTHEFLLSKGILTIYTCGNHYYEIKQ